MKKFIIQELRALDKPRLDESLSGMPSGFTYAITNGFENWAEKKDSSELSNIYETSINLIANKFDGEFAEYLKKSLRNLGRRRILGFKFKTRNFSYVQLLAIISKYLDNPSDASNYENVFELVGVPMIEYFLRKTFGKDSFLSGLKQMTPFLQKVSTGNSYLDGVIFRALNDALKDVGVRGDLKVKMQPFLTSRIDNIASDAEFSNLFNENFLKRMIYGKEAVDKMTMIKQIIRYLPWLKGSLRKKIDESLRNLSYEDMMRLGFNPKNRFPNAAVIDKAAELATKPILEHIIDSSAELYFSDSGFEPLMQVVKDVFKSDLVAKAIKSSVKMFITDGVQKAAELQRKKEEAKRNRKSRRR
jgi:hypothetical protein